MRVPIRLIRFLAVISIILSVTANFLTHSLDMRNLIKGDTLYIQYLFEDIFFKQGRFLDWQFPGAPYFFPDMAIIFSLKAVINNPYFSTLAYALVQLSITYWLGSFLIKIYSSSPEPEEQNHLLEGRLNVFLLFFSLAIFFLVIHDSQRGLLIAETAKSPNPYFYIISSAFHFGNIINMLIETVTVVLLLKGNSISLCYILLFIISALGTGSDALYVVSVAFPSIMALAVSSTFGKLKKTKSFKIALVLSCGVALGFLVKSVLINSITSSFILRKSNLLEQIVSLVKTLSFSFEGMPAAMVFTTLFYGIIFYKIGESIKTREKGVIHFYLYVFIIISVFSTFSALIINGVLHDHIFVDKRWYPNTRYFLNFYWFPILFSWLGFDAIIQTQIHYSKILRNIVLLTTLLISGYFLVPKADFRSSHYPPVAQCVDNALSDYEKETGIWLRNGIAQHDEAKVLSMLSRRELSLFQVGRDFLPSPTINNTNLTRYQPTYDFAVVAHTIPAARPDFERLTRINGEPERDIFCPKAFRPNTRVLIYGKNNLRTAIFTSADNSYTWKACELPIHSSGIAGEGCSVMTRPELMPGIVTFGPYEKLPQGRYRFSIQYSSPAELTETVGSWDVIISFAEKATQLQKGELDGTSNEKLNVSGVFSVAGDYASGNVEVRTLVNGSNPLTVFAITLTKIE